MSTWYATKTSGNQGLVIEEGTGRNVAVSYRTEDAKLLASAPELLAALKDCYAELNQLAFLQGDKLAKITLDKARAAISKAEA